MSGFRYHEGEEIHRRRPDTLFFSLFQLTDPFPAEVHPLAVFPTLAVAAGVTDVYMVFLNFAAGVLGVEGLAGVPSTPGARSDISLRSTLDRWGMRSHVTLYPGGGLVRETDPSVIENISRRSTTVFTSVPELLGAGINMVPTTVPVPGDFYQWRERIAPRDSRLRIAFVGDDRPRKGLLVLLDAMAKLDSRFHLDVVGPHERHADRLAEVGARCHGWLHPARLREVLWQCDVVVSPATRDLSSDGYGDIGMIDGFPTTAARVAMLTGCCLIASNPSFDVSMLKPGEDYIRVPERDPGALAQALRLMREDVSARRRIATQGASTIRRICDVSTVVERKLAQMGFPSRA
ncbi:MAG: glycosyltransferase family 4 protein [Candidatus Dormiibacterota bacterium]